MPITPLISPSNGVSSLSYNTQKKMRKKKTSSCLSCKKLKIKCDKNKPKCEYCEYRNKICEYPDEPNLQVVQLKPNNLNSTTSLMNISMEELFLLKVYDEYHLTILGIREGTIRHDIWKRQVPPLIFESSIIRNSIFGLSSLAVMGTCDLNRANDIYMTDDSPYSIYVTVNSYFHNQVTALKEICTTLNSNNNSQLIKWNDKQIGEILVLNYTFFIFCCLHPHKILPLINYDNGINEEKPDILGIARGFSVSINSIGLKVLESKFAPILFFEERKVQLPPFPLNYKPIESLRRYIDLYRGYMSTSDVELFDVIVRFMELSIYRCFKFKYIVPFFRWMFIFDERMITYLRTQHVFALKIMYVYAILSQFLGFNMSRESNIWINFIEEYKSMGHYLLSGPYRNLSMMIWWDEYDQKLYDLVYSNFRDIRGIHGLEEILDLLDMDEKIRLVDIKESPCT